VFVLLARQLGLDAVVLSLPQGEGKPRRAWLPALLHDKDLYLFDCRLGLPIPGPEGKGVATLAQVAADDSLLRALDLDETHPYPVKAAELQQIVPWIEASPGYLAKRMKLVESRLAGANHVVLNVNASALAKRLTEVPCLVPAVVWPLGYELLQQREHVNKSMLRAMTAEMVVYQAQPKLAVGRTMQFKGRFDGPKGAKEAFMSARPSDTKLQDAKMTPDQRTVYEAAKQNASFWLGVIAFDEGNYPVAIDFFSKRTLEAAPDGPWTASAQYNLGRAYEANGQLEKAIELYEDDDSQQRHGNVLRARRLKSQLAKRQSAGK
jgi:tetratricopeptide (TPR) repeat protein